MPSEAEELAAIEANLQNPALKQAVLASQQGRNAEAKRIAAAFLREHPGDLLALTIAAEAALKSWDLDEAEAKLREVLSRAPSFLRAALLLARCLAEQMRVREAIAVVEDVVRRAPAALPFQRYLARLSADVGDYARTAELYEHILKSPEAQVEDWPTFAEYLRIAGRRSDSQGAFRRALALDPGRAAAWWSLTHYFPADLSERDVEAMRKLVDDPNLPPSAAGLLHVALSAVADRRGDYEEAFREIMAASACRPSAEPYDPDALSREIDELTATFTRGLYEARSEAGSRDRSPIFIIGMPRSGSTLVERILGRHSVIEGAGELQVMGRLADRLRRRAGTGGFGALLTSMTDDELAQLGEDYVRGCRDFRRTDKPMFVDKLNSNWLNLGLIRLILPDAKVIDVRRNAVDCCWSNFRMQFGDAYVGNLRHTARYYRDYVRFVEAIETAAGGILRVAYEEVVDDIEGATRRMLAFLGLESEPQCISFHLSDEPVATPSSEQVRQPLHRRGIGAAEPYRQWLGPLIEELGPLAARR
jgi:tetratricopeptide (TPR) repeat protein